MLIQHEETGSISEIADNAAIPPRWYRVPEAARVATPTAQTPDHLRNAGNPQPRRETQREMCAKHGTPDQFEAAIWRAQADGFVTAMEADAAVRKYKSDYNGAAR